MKMTMFLGTVLVVFLCVHQGAGAAVKPCDFVCPMSLSPVCGSNGDTYDSACDLRMANCKQRSLIKITVAHEGPCENAVPRNSRKACEFVCPLSLSPVCGSDGETYESECDLKKSACLRKSLVKLTKAYDGPCQNAKACEFVCPLSLSPVCGSDGETYESECDLKRSACLRKSLVKLTKAYDGPCQNAKACEFVCPLSLSPVCGSDGETYESECDLKRSACLRRSLVKLTKAYDGPCQTAKECEFVCPLSLSPVCGSDGETYGSECEMKRSSCLRKSLVKVEVAHDGPCEKATPLGKKKPCRFVCALSLIPVCGTDGKTYPSECALRKSACKRRSLNSLTVAFQGPCVETKPCDFVCRFSLTPVCGTDGHTYLNECDLKQTACKRRDSNKLAVAHAGPCECDLVFCRYSETPVCGTDGNTYENECDLKQSSCRQGADVSVKSDGPCAN